MTHKHAFAFLAAVILLSHQSATAIQFGAIDAADHYGTAGGLVITQQLVNLPPWDQIPTPWIGGSGVLIHPRVMLTAGHVVENLEIGLAVGNSQDVVRVSFGSDAYNPSTWIEIEGLVKHPNYMSGLRGNNGNTGPGYKSVDVGVLILKDPVLHVAPTPLPEPYFLDSRLANGDLRGLPQPSEFQVVGYGLADADDVRADGMRRVGNLGFRGLRQDLTFDALGTTHGFSGSRQGDSGGPIFWTDPQTAQEHLVAVVRGWNQKLEPHTRIDVPEVLDFVHSMITLVDSFETTGPAVSLHNAPEPSTLALAFVALVGLVATGRRWTR